MTISLGVPTIPTTGNDQEKISKPGEMELEKFPVWGNISAGISTWILLAGFLVLPSSFSSLGETETNSGEPRKVSQTIRNTPLYVAFFPLISLLQTTKGD